MNEKKVGGRDVILYGVPIKGMDSCPLATYHLITPKFVMHIYLISTTKNESRFAINKIQLGRGTQLTMR